MGNLALWPANESDSEEDVESKGARGGNSEVHLERGCSDLYEDDEDSEAAPSTRKRSAIEEQWEMLAGFELTSVEQETYEKYFYGTEHWNYFTNDEDLGPVILSIKQENLNGRDQFRILVRAISYTVHGLIPASCVFADRYIYIRIYFYLIMEVMMIYIFLVSLFLPHNRYNREEVVRSLGKEINLNPPLTLGQLPDTPEELLKLDQVSCEPINPYHICQSINYFL